MTDSYSPDPSRVMDPFRAQMPALLVGAGGMLVLAISAFFDAEHAVRAYLYAWLFCVGVALGSMSIVMLHHLTGGAWGWLVRRPAEAAAMTLPLLAVLFVPIALGIGKVYPWARADAVTSHALLKHRAALFHPSFVLLRALLYFVIWSFWAWRLRALSLRHDRDGDPRTLGRLRQLSASGLLVYFVTMSLAAVDWIASREVDWYSSTFGLLVIIGQAVAAVAFLIGMLAVLSERSPVKEIAEPDRVHDLGNLLLTVVVLWSYVSFAQYLVIWVGNTQEDTTWYYHRAQHGWTWIGLSLIVLHFSLPFVLLLFQASKRNVRALATIAAGVLFMRLVHVLWMIAPSSLSQHPGTVSWLDFVSPLALGGVWFAAFLWLLKRHPLIPLGFRVPIEPLSYEQGPEHKFAR
jgi:hypothetical protein